MRHTLPPVELAAGEVVAVAVSGGRDSMALLHAVWRRARQIGASVWAFHVDHGLQAGSADWASWVQARCKAWADEAINELAEPGPSGTARLQVAHCRLATTPSAGESVEAWARTHRYAALRDLAQRHGVQRVLLAHHLNDQAETFVLQAARGAGPAGLAGMPMRVQRDGLWWERPWLQVPRSAIESYLQAHAIAFLEDPSNLGQRFRRNRLRQQWPALEAGLPGLGLGLARSARACASALEALDELAQLDLATVLRAEQGDVGCAAGPAPVGDDATPTLGVGQRLSPSPGVSIEALRGLSAARRANLLRHWWHRVTGDRPRMVFLDRLADLTARGVRNGATVPASNGAYAMAHRGCWLARLKAGGSSAPAFPAEAARVAAEAHLSPAKAVALCGWGGTLQWTDAEGLGVAGLVVQIRPRQAGDRLSLGAQRPLRCLKKQFQALGVPADDRDGPVLTLPDGRILWVHGLGWNAPVADALGLGGHLAWVRSGDPRTL